MNIEQVPTEIIFNSGRVQILSAINEAKKNYMLPPTYVRGILYEALVKCEEDILSQQQYDYGKMINELEKKGENENGIDETVPEN